MNKDQARGRMSQLTARIKQEWGKLTDDEVMQAEGNIDELIGRVQEKYGDSRENVAARINELKEKLDNDEPN